MRLQLLREQEKQILKEKKIQQQEYERYKEIQEKKKKLQELYQAKLEEKQKLEQQKEQIQLNYQQSLEEIQKNKKLQEQRNIQKHQRQVQLEANNILREKVAYEFLKEQQQEKFQQRNKQKLLKQKALDQEKERTEKILQAYQLKKKNKRKYVIKNQFENQEQLIQKHRNQNSRLGFKFYKQQDDKNAFEKAQQEEIDRQILIKEKEAELAQTQLRAQQSIKKMLEQRDQNEREAIMEYHRIETNLIKLQQQKDEQFEKNKRAINKKKKKLFEQKLSTEYLPELERINKILIKKNFAFLDEVAKKRKAFYVLKEVLFKVDQLKEEHQIDNINMNYSQSEKEIEFDVTQSQEQIQKDFSELKSIDMKEEIQNPSNSSFGNLSDFDIKAFLEQEQRFLDDLNKSNEQQNKIQNIVKNPPKNFRKKDKSQKNIHQFQTNENIIKEKLENKFVNQISNSVIQEEKSEEMSYSSEQRNFDFNSKNSSQAIKIKDYIENVQQNDVNQYQQQNEQLKIREMLNKHNISISDDSDEEEIQQEIIQNEQEKFQQEGTKTINQSQKNIFNLRQQEEFDVNITVKKKDQDMLQKKKELLEKRKNYKPKMFQKKRNSRTKNNQYKQIYLDIVFQLSNCINNQLYFIQKSSSISQILILNFVLILPQKIFKYDLLIMIIKNF